MSERLYQVDSRDGIPDKGGSSEHWREVGKIGVACDRKDWGLTDCGLLGWEVNFQASL